MQYKASSPEDYIKQAPEERHSVLKENDIRRMD